MTPTIAGLMVGWFSLINVGKKTEIFMYRVCVTPNESKRERKILKSPLGLGFSMFGSFKSID